jgi:protein-tyrosine-phosphatase/DNA-binding HxlR family transcriptional regulator
MIDSMITEQTGAVERRAAIHAALGDPHRLVIVDELALSDRSPSELRQRLGIESNLVAHHLEVLERVGLIERVVSIGDRRRKYLRLLAAPLEDLVRPATLAAGGVVFVCTANSARSQIAAALWNARSTVPAVSAGTAPAARVHPEAVQAAARAGLDLSAARPRALTDADAAVDLVVTVCDRAHEQPGPLAGRPVLHWSVADPAAAGTPAAFDQALRHLDARIGTLAPLVMLSPN